MLRQFFLQMLNVKNFVSLDSALIFVLKVFLALLVDGVFLADVTWLVRPVVFVQALVIFKVVMMISAFSHARYFLKFTNHTNLLLFLVLEYVYTTTERQCFFLMIYRAVFTVSLFHKITGLFFMLTL